MNSEASCSIQEQLVAAQCQQERWARLDLRTRASAARRVAALIVDRLDEWLPLLSFPERSGAHESITAELMPLADAGAWLSKNAPSILQPHSLGARGRPIWLGRTHSIVYREAWGTMLLIGTWNYPLFLLGVPSLQALVAGNALCIKPAPGTEPIVQKWKETLVDSGIPSELIAVVDSHPTSVQKAIQFGVQHVVLIGSSPTGRLVAADLASHLIPSTMELSGCDALIVLESADLERTVKAISYGLQLNSSATCMAPRRLLIARSIAPALQKRLVDHLAGLPEMMIRKEAAERALELVRLAISEGAQTLVPTSGQLLSGPEVNGYYRMRPLLLTNVSPKSRLAQQDIFAPILMLMSWDDLNELSELDRSCPYGLSASIFGDPLMASQVALQLKVGFVTINDLILPTADPRLPFGGRRESGYGVTRGREGLLAMTQLKVVSQRSGSWLPHLEKPQSSDFKLIQGYLQWRHGAKWRCRLQGLQSIASAIVSRTRKGKTP